MRQREYALPHAWEDAVERWLNWLRLGGTRPTTLRLRRGHVRSIARKSGTAHPAQLTLPILVDVFNGRSWSNEHRKGLRRSLVSFYEWACANGVTSANPALGLPTVTGDRPRPRPATDAIWENLLVAAPPRERLMARLAGEVGMRRAEVAQCHRDDLIRDAQGWALIVHGKGGKQRVVPATDDLANEILRFCPAGYLFPSLDQWGNLLAPHVSAHHVGKLISALMPPGWSMHKLRHRYASLGYAGTRDLIAVKEALGHESVATTQIYVASVRDAVRAVSEAAAHRPKSRQ